MSFKSPWVSRALYDQAIMRAVAAEKRADDAAKQVAFAFEQSTKANDSARLAIGEARGALREAIEMGKIASRSLFGTGAETPETTSIGANDALVARKRREAEDAAQRNARA